MTKITKMALRDKCRKRWGKEWWKVHPVLKLARLQWAAGDVSTTSDRVHVHEVGGSYVV